MIVIITSNSNWTECGTIQGVIYNRVSNFKIGQAQSARPI